MWTRLEVTCKRRTGWCAGPASWGRRDRHGPRLASGISSLARWDRSKRRDVSWARPDRPGVGEVRPDRAGHGGAHRHNPKRESASARVVPTDWAADFYSGAGVHNTELAIENRFLNRAKDLASREKRLVQSWPLRLNMVILSLFLAPIAVIFDFVDPAFPGRRLDLRVASCGGMNPGVADEGTAPSIILAMKRVWVRLAITQLNENAIIKKTRRIMRGIDATGPGGSQGDFKS
jgi:hypothetical protein